MFSETLLTTMFHTAQLSDDISQNTLQALLRSYKHLTGKTVTQKMIGAKYAQRTETSDLLSIMAPFARIERDTIMKACIDVAAADGAITMTEHDFLMELNTALELDDTWFRNQVSVALRPDTPQTMTPRPMPVTA
jgi:tellurite resistance protein